MSTSLYIFIASFSVIFAGLISINAFIEKKRRETEEIKDYVVLSLRVPNGSELGPLAAEQMFASMHGLHRNIGWKERLFGESQEKVSFEIAIIDSKIKFYARAPRHMQEFVESAIYSQYPDVEVTEVDDYSRAHKAGTYSGAELLLNSEDFIPIKTGEFKDQGSGEILDTLSSITQALGQTNAGDECYLQIICEPAGDEWQQRGMNMVEALRRGERPAKKSIFTSNIILRITSLPFRILGAIVKVFFARSPGEGDAPQKVELTDREKLMADAIMEKANFLGYHINMRIAYYTGTDAKTMSKIKIQSIAGAFKQFNTTHLNGFKARTLPSDTAISRYQNRAMVEPYILNIQELSEVFHLPSITVKVPNIEWVKAKKLEPPINLPRPNRESDLTTIGTTNFRNSRFKYGIKPDDRRRHAYIIGKTGMGKSVLLENMIDSDIKRGVGLCVIDPHGDLVDKIITLIPKNRIEDVMIIDPTDGEFPVSFNMFDGVRPEDRNKIADGVVSIFYKLWKDSWGPRMEYILQNSMLALIEAKDTTMMGLTRILVDEGYREHIVSQVTDPVVLSFWRDEFANYSPKDMPTIIGPIQNKVGQFLSVKSIRNILGQKRSKVNFREAMDTNKIVIVNLSKGKLGESNSALLGGMIISKIQIDAMSRADVPEEERPDFSLYVDEFQNFATDSFASILSEARKYHLCLTMANQYVNQMEDTVRDAVFGNVGSMINFQISFDDAIYFKGQYGEVVEEKDLVDMAKYTIYNRILIDGMPTKTFSANTIPPVDPPPSALTLKEAYEASRKKYSVPVKEVEEEIKTYIDDTKKIVVGVDGKKIVDVDAVISKMKIGDIYPVTFGKAVGFGIFIDYEGASGLIHISQLPKELGTGLEEKFQHKGKVFNAKLMEITGDKKLNFSLKGLMDKDFNPIETKEVQEAKAKQEATKTTTPKPTTSQPATQRPTTSRPTTPRTTTPQRATQKQLQDKQAPKPYVSPELNKAKPKGPTFNLNKKPQKINLTDKKEEEKTTPNRIQLKKKSDKQDGFQNIQKAE